MSELEPVCECKIVCHFDCSDPACMCEYHAMPQQDAPIPLPDELVLPMDEFLNVAAMLRIPSMKIAIATEMARYYGRGVVRGMKHSEAALALAREALVDAQEELRLIREKDCNAVYNPLLRTVTIPLALESSRAALATQPGKATGQASPSEQKPNPK